jgi:hypothetical protein
MNQLLEVSVSCPYCGEMLDILVDESDCGNDYIEDCQVCCRPMVIHPSVGPDGATQVVVKHEDET